MSSQTNNGLDLFNAWLKTHFQLAWNIPTLHAFACNAIVGELVEGDDLPNSSVYRMMAVVDVQYRAALQALVHAESSLGAQTLMRGLIEAWAHIDFIWSEGLEGASCRALSIELGWLLERKRMYQNFPESVLPGLAPHLAAIDSNLEVVETLWASLKCQGKSRSYGSVNTQVTKMAKRPGLEWLIPMWRLQSEATHMGTSEWLFTEVAEGRNEIHFPSSAHRATWFQDALILYNNVAVTVIRILRNGANPDSQAENEYGIAFQLLCQNARLRELIIVSK